MLVLIGVIVVIILPVFVIAVILWVIAHFLIGIVPSETGAVVHVLIVVLARAVLL